MKVLLVQAALKVEVEVEVERVKAEEKQECFKRQKEMPTRRLGRLRKRKGKSGRRCLQQREGLQRRKGANVQGSGKTRGKRKRKADSERIRKRSFARRSSRRWKRKIERSLSMWNTHKKRQEEVEQEKVIEKGEEKEERKQQAAAGNGVLAASQVIQGRGLSPEKDDDASGAVRAMQQGGEDAMEEEADRAMKELLEE
eukprot:04147_3